jgi:hypothetical protein
MDTLGRPLVEFGVPVMFVMKAFEDREFPTEMVQIGEPLTMEKQLVVRVVEAFHHTVAPRFSFGDKHHLDAKVETQTDQQAEASWVTVGASERELVVQLQIARDPQALPLRQKCLTNGLCTLAGKGLQGDSVAAGIHEVEGIEARTPNEIAGSHQVHLV